MPLPASGIAHDLGEFLLALIQGGSGASQHLETSGDGAAPLKGSGATAGNSHKILPDTNAILPAFTVVNSGNSTVYIGWGTATFPLGSGASYTFRWKNPRARGGLVMNDAGSAATLDVMS